MRAIAVATAKADDKRNRHSSEDAHIGIVAPMIGCSRRRRDCI